MALQWGLGRDGGQGLDPQWDKGRMSTTESESPYGVNLESGRRRPRWPYHYSDVDGSRVVSRKVGYRAHSTCRCILLRQAHHNPAGTGNVCPLLSPCSQVVGFSDRPPPGKGLCRRKVRSCPVSPEKGMCLGTVGQLITHDWELEGGSVTSSTGKRERETLSQRETVGSTSRLRVSVE